MDHFENIFHCKMIGSFNIKMDESIMKYPPFFFIPEKFNHINAQPGQWFWLVRLDGKYFGWAFRWAGSRQRENIWEIISENPFPEELKSGAIDVKIYEEFEPEILDAIKNLK
jgi:hypothetical protein